jgi:hypothetical protein
MMPARRDEATSTDESSIRHCRDCKRHPLQAYGRSMRTTITSTKKRLLLFPGILLAYLLLIAILYPGLVSEFSREVPFGSAADLKFILSIVDFSIHSALRDLYNFPIFYPQSGSLALTHPLFGISLFYKVFQWLGVNLEQSTNLYIIMGLLLGALGCFLFAREVSGSDVFSFVFSILYIVHRKNLPHFIWLNFFSRFWVPFILYFLLRFFRSGRQRYVAAAAALSFMEFFACIYLGTSLGAFLLPAFILFAWVLRLIDWRGLLRIVAWFMLALGLIGVVFYPYLKQSQVFDVPAKKAGVSPADFFQFHRWLASWLGEPHIDSETLFPGLAIMACFVLFFVPLRSKKRLLFFLLLFVPVPVLSVLAFSPGPLLEALFLLWMIMLAVALALKWREMSGAERLVVISFCFFLLVNLNFDFLPGLRSLSLYWIYDRLLPPIRGLRHIQRAFFLILPMFTAMAATGAARHFRRAGRDLWLRLAAAALFVLVLAENIYLPIIFAPGRIMKPIPYKDTAVYHHLPFRSNLVVLEVPYYFRFPVGNAQYLLNWRLHRNYLLNGKAWVRPLDYWLKLSRIIGKIQREFPTDSQLRRLLQEYSVQRVIIHWDLLRAYQRKNFNRQRTWAKIQRLQNYGRVVVADAKTVVIEVQEFIPVTAVIRTYSDFHLRRHRVYVRLKSPPASPVIVRLNGKEAPPPLVSGNQLLVDLRSQELNATGNRVEIRFARPQTVRMVKLWPEKAPLPF